MAQSYTVNPFVAADSAAPPASPRWQGSVGDDDDVDGGAGGDAMHDISLDGGDLSDASLDVRRRSFDGKLPGGPSRPDLRSSRASLRHQGDDDASQVLLDDSSTFSLLAPTADSAVSFLQLWELSPKRLKLVVVLFAVLSFSLLIAVLALLTNLPAQPSALPVAADLAPGYRDNEQYYRQLDSAPPLQPLDLARADRLSDAVVSPSQQLVVFCRRVWNVRRNVSTTTLMVKQLDQPDADARPLTPPAWGVVDACPNWSPDSSHVVFLSNRQAGDGRQGAGERTQIWQVNVHSGALRALSNFSLDVDQLLLSPAGHVAALSFAVYPGLSVRATAERDAAAPLPPPARRFDKLMVRHWDRWSDGKRSHLFVAFLSYDRRAGGYADVDAERLAERGRDTDQDVPTFDGGRDEWSFSPDGSRLSYVVHADDSSTVHAFSTNLDVRVLHIDAANRSVTADRCLTCANRAQDSGARMAPTQQRVAVLAMATPGYESDRQRVVVYSLDDDNDDADPRTLAADWPLSAKQLVWSHDAAQLYIVAADDGRDCIFALAVDSDASSPQRLYCGGSVQLVQAVGAAQLLVFASNFTRPAELFLLALSGGDAVPLTDYSAGLRTKVLFSPEPVRVRFVGANNDTVSGWYVPATRTPSSPQRAPLALLIHGGPQGSWSDGWSYRWNPYVFSAQGFAVAMFDVHGSFGYGQPFVDAIRGDYGGAPYQDLMLGLDWLLAAHADELDGDNVCALGASYGGYMVNWINGHTDRFRSLVVHDGIFSLPGLYYETEELWFPTHDQYGPPWQPVEPGSPCYPDTCYVKWDPARHVDQWRTPTLVIHGSKDYRIPDTHGISAFTALQARGVDSRLLIFPTENHWVLSPVNSMYWHEQVFAWIHQYAAD